MSKRDHPMIEQILTLIDLFQNHLAASGQLGAGSAQKSGALPAAAEIKAARDFISFMEEMPGGFLIYRADGGEDILYANQGLQRIYGCESMEEFRLLTGNSFRGMVVPEDLPEVQESIRRQIASSRFDLDYVEYRAIRRDGAVRWIEDYGHFAHSESVGDIFYVFLVDATEKNEQARREQARLVHEKEASDQKWQELIDEYDKERELINQEYLRRLEVIEGLSVNYESIFYVDLDGGTILPYRTSGRTRPIFGEPHITQEYAAAMAVYVQTWVHPSDRARVERETNPAYIRQRLSGESTFCLNYRVVEDGAVGYLQIRFVNAGRKDRASQAVMGCRRMDEELQMEMEQKQVLEEALNNANSSIVAKNTFLSNMSHDMRTPLNAIFGFTALARHNLANPEALGGYLDRIEASSRQLLDMIDKVLKLSWMDSNEARAEEEPCSLREILAEVYDFLLPQAEEKGLAFTMDCTQTIHDAVFGDREKLNQLVMYLANNAVTYTQAGGCVSLSAVEREELPNGCAVYQIVVQDTGIGIGEEFIQQIFEPFTRERNTTLSGIHGVGLGLTIARNIAELLGGSIEVQSAVGEGSTFTVTLRLRLQPCGEAVPAEEDGPASILCRHILLVEDNLINQEIEMAILTHIGFTVDTAGDGKEAVEMVSAAPPETYDLILMDIQMPVMDGWEAARAIRALPEPGRAAVPIVALSANVFESDMQKSLDAGMDAHLAKPLDVPALLRAIQEIVRRTK